MSLWKSEMSRSESISWKKAETSMLTNTQLPFSQGTLSSALCFVYHINQLFYQEEGRPQGKGKQSKITSVARPEVKCRWEKVNCFLIVFLVEKNWHWTRGIPIERETDFLIVYLFSLCFIWEGFNSPLFGTGSPRIYYIRICLALERNCWKYKYSSKTRC